MWFPCLGFPELWVSAAQWEVTENNSMETGRSLLQRGLRFNTNSKHLWQEVGPSSFDLIYTFARGATDTRGFMAYIFFLNTYNGHPIACPWAVGMFVVSLEQDLSFNSSDAGEGIFRLWGSIPWLLMPWLLKSPEHQQSWYWLCWTDNMYCCFRVNFIY